MIPASLRCFCGALAVSFLGLIFSPYESSHGTGVGWIFTSIQILVRLS